MPNERCQKSSGSHVSSAYKRIQLLKLRNRHFLPTPYAIRLRNSIEILWCRRPKETRESDVAWTLRNCAALVSAISRIGMCKDHR
jgi:hypothetical protein